MRNLLVALTFISLSLSLFCGCKSSSNIEGKEISCIGLDREGEDHKYVYKTSVRNVVLGVVFFEVLFVPPIVVLLDELYCPVALKDPRP